MRTKFWLGSPKGRHHSEDLGVNGTIILKSILRKWGDSVDWIYLAQDRDRWRIGGGGDAESSFRKVNEGNNKYIWTYSFLPKE
jgi:hypothetical protein